MTDYLRNVSVFPKLHAEPGAPSEWRVMLEVTGTFSGIAFPLTPTEAKDLSQKLFSLALEISEREAPTGPPAESPRVQELERELEREKQKRQELARKVAPAAKLEAAKSVLRSAIAGYEMLRLDDVPASGPSSSELKAALAWLEEFKA